MPVSRREICLALVALPWSVETAGAQIQVPRPYGCPATAPRPTPAQTEGPYFKAGAPLRSNLAGDDPAGRPLRLRGTVIDTACRPVAGAVVDLWQADSAGGYDLSGFKLRGRQSTASNGVFEFETVVPGLYPGRTRHLHIKIAAPGRRVLTTQLYFPDEPGNARDRIFDPALVMATPTGQGGPTGTFTFVLG